MRIETTFDAEIKNLLMKISMKGVEEKDCKPQVHNDLYWFTPYPKAYSNTLANPLRISTNHHLVNHKAFFQTGRNKAVTLPWDSHTVLRMKDTTHSLGHNNLQPKMANTK